MTSEGGMGGNKNLSSAPVSDDEISVIAEIKKGTSGIPKRARYHYIRELPLASVKSLKKSLQKGKVIRRSQGRALIPAIEGCFKTKLPTMKEAARVVHEIKKPRVIELSDEASKMELRKQFNMPEELYEEKEQLSNAGPSSLSTSGNTNIIHKLPPGTVLIKQEPKTPRRENQDDNQSLSNPTRENDAGSNTNGSSAGTTTATTTTSTSSSNAGGSSSASSVSSCGSGSSSGSFGSVSASPIDKAKRIYRASDGESGKKIVEVIPRRNPKRCGTSKKGFTMPEAAIIPTTTMTTRPRQRQRLLATRRQKRNEGTVVTVTNRRTKLTTMPYMNTRSVTRKLYTVGATHQPPTRKDETEWREWPVHGMHERPVFHPQIGLATGYGGRVFWSTPDAEGSNWTYREVLDVPEEVEIVPVDPRPSQTLSSPLSIKTGLETSEESFKVCMHDSLHSVLAYCAQVMTPGYRNMVEEKRHHSLEARAQTVQKILPQKDAEERYADVELLDAESTHLNLSRLEDSAISDETLMEMSSIYKKLLPIEDQPSSREGSPSSGNNHSAKNTNEGCSSVTKNSSEASEIARILSEYNEGLKDTVLSGPSSSAIPVTAPQSSFVKNFREAMDPGLPEVQQKTLVTGKTLSVHKGVCRSDAQDVFSADIPKTASETEINDDHWLQELLVDTSLLYCVANGVDQRDLTKYVDSLDRKQSLQWLRRRDG